MMNFIPQLIFGIIIFFVFFAASIITAKMIIKFTAHLPADTRNLFQLFSKVAKWILIIIGVITALGNIGVNVAALIAGLGLTSFGLGLALKDALSNVLSGILVLIYRPFKINDQVKIGEAQGVVVNIDLRYVTLQAEKQKILIPNSSLFNNTITIF